MISKERLEELIKEEAVIYWGDCDNNCVTKIGLCKRDIIHYDALNTISGYYLYPENIFETKEEAEFYIEFSNISRIETLILPTWEEIEKLKKLENVDKYVEFKGKGKNNVIYGFGIWLYDNSMTIINNSTDTIFFSKHLTRENYIEACNICKKLFLEVKV